MGLYLIITSWVIQELPLWFRIVNTILGAIEILGTCTTIINIEK